MTRTRSLRCADDDIEVGGPRGSARGNAVLRDWLDRAGIRLEPRRWFASPTDLVVEQVATWRGPDGGVTDPEIIASSFTVENGLVRRTVRYGSLDEALAATGLTLSDQILASHRGWFFASRIGVEKRFRPRIAFNHDYLILRQNFSNLARRMTRFSFLRRIRDERP